MNLEAAVLLIIISLGNETHDNLFVSDVKGKRIKS